MQTKITFLQNEISHPAPHTLWPHGQRPGSSVHGIFQARVLEWVAIFYSRVSSQPGIESASLASPALEADFFSLYHLGNPTLDPFINSSTVSFTHCGKTGVSLLPKLFPSWWIHLKSRWEWNWGYVNGQDSWMSSGTLFCRTWASRPSSESEVCVRQVSLCGKKVQPPARTPPVAVPLLPAAGTLLSTPLTSHAALFLGCLSNWAACYSVTNILHSWSHYYC